MNFPVDACQAVYPSPLGDMHLVATPDALVGVWFEQQAHLPVLIGLAVDSQQALLRESMHQLAQYFAGSRQQFELPLYHGWGTPFQQLVWQALTDIPYGQTSTYQAIAQAIGRPRSTRAVGAAVGRNPFSLVVPCHRVIGAQGQLTGYAGGLARKQALLQLENPA